MNADEYLKLAEVEDGLWYFHSLHRHVRRELSAALNGAAAPPPRSGKNAAPPTPRLRRATGPLPRRSPEGEDGRAPRPQQAVLDAGCGTGGMILRLRAMEPAWRWSGIDFMPLACELARKRCGPAVDVREASVTALPFADASFDAVVSADVICQVDNPEVAVAEFFRMLRPGGTVVINVPAYMWMWSYHDDSCQTKHRYTRPEIAALLRGAGFTVSRLTHLNAIPFPLIWAKRKLLRSDADTSDMKAYPAPVELAFRAMTAIERGWLRLGGAWAWGSSVFAVAKKPE